MKTYFFKTYLILFAIAFSFFSCEKKQKHQVQKKQISFKPPISIIGSCPILILSDTCPKPNFYEVPEKNVVSYIFQTKKGPKTFKHYPPESTPLTAGEAGGFTYMPNYNTEQGLALSSVTCGFKDKSGNLWFGTQGGGVSRYDGKSFANFNTAQGLASISVLSILEDKCGNLWFSTYGGGVSRYDGRSFTNFTKLQGLASNNILCSTIDKTGKLWFGTHGFGVSSFDGNVFKNFTEKEGLSNNNVRAIIEDKCGNLWFGTDEGISKYDGNRVDAIEGGDKNAQQTQQDIRKINGKLVKSFTNFTEKDGLINNAVVSMLEDKKGNIWFGTGRMGVSRYNPQNKSRNSSFTNITTAQGLVNNNVLCITEDKTGNIWFGTNGGGISRYSCPDKNGKSFFTNFTTAQGLTNNTVWSITEDETGNLWFGTYGGGISRYDGKAFTDFTKGQGLGENKVFGITEDKSGNLWFGTYEGGLSRYNGKCFTNFKTSQGLAGDAVFCGTSDNNGSLWFGSESGGVSRYALPDKFGNSSFTNFTTIQGLADNGVSAVFKDKIGNIWLGTSHGGVSKYDGSRIEAIEKGDTIALKTQKDLKKINGKLVKSFTNFSTDQGLAFNKILCITDDKKGNLWFGTEGGGVSRYDGNRVDAIENGEKVSQQEQQDLKKINGKLVKTFTNYTTDQGLANNTVFSIIEDKFGNIWFATSGGGVSCIRRKHPSTGEVNSALENTGKKDGEPALFTNFTTAQGLADDVVYAVAEDPLSNMIWFGTNLGLSGLKLNSISFEKGAAEFENFNINTGYPIKDLNSNALFIDSKGIIWAGTGDKLVRFDYKGLNKSMHPPKVVIQSIKINNENICWNNLAENLDKEVLKKKSELSKSESGNNNSQINNGSCLKDSLYSAVNSLSVSPNIIEEIATFGRALTDAQREIMAGKFSDIKFDDITPFYPLPENLVLPYKHNNVTFDFAAVEPARPLMVRYKYILDGYDNEWSPLTNKTTAAFGNIHEGDYTFRLQALNPDGIWSKPVTYTFKVLPPFYRAGWMYCIYIISVLGILYSLYYARTASLRREKEILEHTVRLRTYEVVKQKNIVEEKNIIVEKQKKMVEEKNTVITDSIEYAQNIQQAILPSEEEISKHFQNHFIFYLPKDIVSGDFYWIYEDKERVWIAAADCTGHGVAGAFMALLGNNLLNDSIKVNAKHSPSEILDELNTQILNILKQNNKNASAKYGMDIALISIDKKMTELEYAGAHHSLLIFRGRECIQIKANQRSIGFIKKYGESGFVNHNFKLVKGDMLYIFSDGYADQIGGPEKKKVFSQPFRDLLQSVCELEMLEQKKILNKTIMNWKGNINQTDDILVLGIRI